jgi:hypothetical protein
LTLSRKLSALSAVVLIGGFLLVFAGDGLRAYFTPDDMMNLYGAWFRPLAEQDRPVGTLFYRAIFAVFGLNPLPYRIACFAILAGNLALLYFLCLKLSCSREVAALACLLGAYHAHLADLYYSTGTVYDLLCFLFYFSALLLYIRVRERAWPWLIPVFALYLAALGAKEMAVTLPLFLGLYELIYHPPGKGSAAVRAWSARELRRLGPFALAAAAFILRKTLGPARMTANPDYLPHFTWKAMIAGWKHYGYDLFYGVVPFTGWRVVLLWMVMLAIAFTLRRRSLWFAVGLIWLGLLPVILITPRGFFTVYLTLPGWYLFGAQTLAAVRDRLVATGVAAHPAVLFLAVAALLAPLHWRQKPRGNAWVAGAHASVRTVLAPLHRYSLPRAARVLVLDDPFPADDWILTFIFRLAFRDDEVQVHRAKSPPAAPAEPYDRVFLVAGNRLVLVSSRTP